MGADLAWGAELAGAAEVELECRAGGGAAAALLGAHGLMLRSLLPSLTHEAEAEALQLADEVGVVIRVVSAHLAAHRRACVPQTS